MHRMMKTSLIFFFSFFLLTACTIPQTTNREKGMPAAAKSEPKATPTTVSRAANLERDLRQALAASTAAAVSREGDHLAVTFQGDVTFDKGSAIVKPILHAEISRLARVLAQYPEAVIRVEGHTDSKGSDALNMKLSMERAESVRNLLFKQGVGNRWIGVAGFGKNRPIAGNDTEAGRQQNRRVEIMVFPQTK
jgi:outer membrane protein OmpA-like peptidoglycan-associated protein